MRDARAAAQQLARRGGAWAASVRAGEDALRRFGDAAGFLGAAEAELADLAALLQRVAAAPARAGAPPPGGPPAAAR